MDRAAFDKKCDMLKEFSENQNAKGTKRRWTIEEDAVLVQGLLQLVVDGWKTNAGTFKQGYTKVLEKYLHTKIPNCSLKARPHIESRVKRLKMHYYAIKDMLRMSTSGFEWDDTRKMIVVEKEVYNQWCKTHPTAIGLYGKPFPHFDNLDVAFAKNKGNESTFNLKGDEENFESQIPETPTFNTTTQASNPINQPQYDATSYSTGKREGKRVKYNNDDDCDSLICDSLLTLLNKLDEVYAETVKNIQLITSYFLHEKDTTERRNQIVPLLTEIEGLSTTDVVKATVLFFKNNNLCDCFFAMDAPELRKEFVYFVLNNNVVP